MEQERWKDIEGFEGFYQISDYGKVKSFNNNGYGKRKIGKLLSPSKDRYGYYFVNLSLRNKLKRCQIARLVALYFIPNLDNKPQTNHKDGVKANNHYANLEWMTSSENIIHSYRVLGRKCVIIRGELNYNAKLKEKEVIEIREKYKTNDYSQRQLAKIYNVGQSTIGRIVKNQQWGWLI